MAFSGANMNWLAISWFILAAIAKKLILESGTNEIAPQADQFLVSSITTHF